MPIQKYRQEQKTGDYLAPAIIPGIAFLEL